MADQKISELTALTSGVTVDYLPIVDQSAGQVKKITISGLLKTPGEVLRTNLLSKTGFQVWSNSGLTQGAGVGRQTDFEIGSDLVTNGGFDSDSDWTKQAPWTIAGGVAVGNTATSSIYQAPTLEIGKLYKIVYTISGYVSGSVTSAANNFGFFGKPQSSDGTHSDIFVATVGAGNPIGIAGTAFDGNIDNISLYEVTPGCVAADTLGPDGWEKSGVATVQLFREPNGSNTKDGEYYACKIVSTIGLSTEDLQWPRYTNGIQTNPEFYKKWSGQTVTFGTWVKASAANELHLRIGDGVSNSDSTNNVGTDWEWLEITKIVSISNTQFRVSVTSVDGNYTAYISQPMLVFGSSIGEGNYVPPQDKVIWLENETVLEIPITYSSDASIAIEAVTSGKIGKGMKAFHLTLRGSSATVEKQLILATSSTMTRGITIISQVANVVNANSGWVGADANGNLYILRDDTFNEVDLYMTGVEVR